VFGVGAWVSDCVILHNLFVNERASAPTEEIRATLEGEGVVKLGEGYHSSGDSNDDCMS
jgi:hypothetical protein